MPEQEPFIGNQSGGRVFLFLNTDVDKIQKRWMRLRGFAFILVAIFVLTGCNVAEPTLKPDNSCSLVLDSELLKTANEGSLKSIKVKLFSAKSSLEELYGKPDEIGFNNAEYLKYGNCYFYIWEDSKIGVIDVEIDFSVDQVKETLGKPDFEGNPDAGFDEYTLGYKTGEYYLYFKYQDKESNTGIFRFKKIS
jgi:hypothetical protein